MSLQELLNELAKKGVQLWVEEKNLRIRVPKNSLSESNRNQLTEYKEEIIKLLQQQSLKEKKIKPISREFPLCLSLEQERLWLANQLLSAKTGVYNLVQAIQLQGKLEIRLLEKSINTILQRHETLRTTFTIQENNIIQVINNFTCSLPVENCLNSDIKSIADAEFQKPFDLNNDPLWRFRLLKIVESEHILIFTFHHLIGDILSTSILIKELAELYNSFLNQKNPSLPKLSIQYADFAFWQRQEIKTQRIQQKLIYWENEFKEVPEQLMLPYDSANFDFVSLEGRHEIFKLSKELWLELKQFSQQENVTPAIFLLATFEVFLYRISQQKDIVIAYPTLGRFHPQLESLIGFFAYPLPFRINLSDSLTFQELLKQVKNKNVEFIKNQDVPFSQIIERVGKANLGLFKVLFSTFLGKQLDTVNTFSELTLTLLPEASRTPTDLDLVWSFYEVEKELQGVIGYNNNLFKSETIKEFIESYCSIIKQCIKQPKSTIENLQLTEKLATKVQNNHETNQKPNLVIAATFTAELITHVINFWLKELNLSYIISFAPYNQVFQQLLDPNNLFRKNKNGINCILIRFEDWLRFNTEKGNEQQKLEKSLQDFILALQELIKYNKIPLLICICPSLNKDISKILENQLILAIDKLNGIDLVTSSEIHQLYPIENYYNSQSDELGHIPYTTEFFTALGTTIIRRNHLLKQKPYKVVVLDCDYTLWQGICGEDELEKIIIDEPCRQLQQFIIKQKNKGMLLCLCSKNTEKDVKRVFEKHLDMILEWKDFVATRINWQTKSSNIKALSEELNLSLDSFIFIDDNPVECAEIKTTYPEVLTLQLPEVRDNTHQFFKHIWVFDKYKITIEDTKRANFYQENLQRHKILQNSLTLADFINSLNVQVKISSLETKQISRISQLTQRTNQFNVSTIRRTENEIQNLLNSGYNCLTVNVKDRFGDYGLVGTIIYKNIQNKLEIDTFLLSCRTLGKGIEYRMIAEIGKIALENKIEWIEINYQRTEKNEPILYFLQQIGKEYQDGYCFRFPAVYASQVIYIPESETVTFALTPKNNKPFQKIIANSDLYYRIATQLATLKQINQAIASISNTTNIQQNYIPPRNEIETCLAKIWSELLKIKQVGINDNFFELGGDSILMIQIVVQAKQAGLDITPIQLFEHQTIAELATIIQSKNLVVIKHPQYTKIDHNKTLNTENYRPSDFPDVNLTQEELDDLLASLE